MTASDTTRDSVRVHLRWRDLDSLGHLYHAAAVELLDEARAAWMSVNISPEVGESHVVARLEIDYLGEVSRADRTLDVATALSRIGNSSLKVEQTVRNRGGTAVLACVATVIAWNSTTHASRPLSDEERAKLALLPVTDERAGTVA